MKSKFSHIYVFFAVLFLIGFVPFVFFLKWVHSPVPQTQQEVVYYVAEGQSVHEIAFGLQKQNIISHPKLFKLYTKLIHCEKKLKFGTFVFTPNMTPADILHKLVKGDTLRIKITIPEGLNIYQVSNKLSQAFPQYSTDTWLKLMFDENLIQLLPVSKTYPKSLEGFLLPDTYFFDPGEKPEIVLKAFISHFKQVVTDDMWKRAEQLNLTSLEFVTLASIIQKESSIESELTEIAAVFFNRLRINMKLQSDPTAIYGAWEQYQGRVTKKHLRAKNLYNTYTRYGLPVGPIANPGLTSLNAVLNPAQSNALYFVATGDGTHIFSSSYSVHRKAVQKYIQYLRSHAR